jgi:RNA polymerase subunit RPABC4/transcription elongation factor Spt4
MSKKYYQMLWDCEYCGAKGLLAKDQKVCPQCGGKQNADHRYMPDMAQAQEVVGHSVKGCDRVCGACGRVMPVDTVVCPGCGNDMEDAAEVKRQQALAPQPPQPAAHEARPVQKSILGSIRWSWVFSIGFPLLLAVAYYAYPALDSHFAKSASFTLTRKYWTTSIEVEKYGPETRTYTCEVPRGLLPKSRGILSGGELVLWTQPAPVGVQVAQVDEGDGTFSVDDAGGSGPSGTTSGGSDNTPAKTCTETVWTWSHARSLNNSGEELPITWPQVILSKEEREGPHHLDFQLDLYAQEDENYATCTVNPSAWKNARIGSLWTLSLGGISKEALCETLAPAKP